jgi:hypothetical protein
VSRRIFVRASRTQASLSADLETKHVAHSLRIAGRQAAGASPDTTFSSSRTVRPSAAASHAASVFGVATRVSRAGVSEHPRNTGSITPSGLAALLLGQVLCAEQICTPQLTTDN